MRRGNVEYVRTLKAWAGQQLKRRLFHRDLYMGLNFKVELLKARDQIGIVINHLRFCCAKLEHSLFEYGQNGGVQIFM